MITFGGGGEYQFTSSLLVCSVQRLHTDVMFAGTERLHLICVNLPGICGRQIAPRSQGRLFRPYLGILFHGHSDWSSHRRPVASNHCIIHIHMLRGWGADVRHLCLG